MSKVERTDRFPAQAESLGTLPDRGKRSATPAASKAVAPHPEPSEAPPTSPDPAPERPECRTEKTSVSEQAPRSTGRHWMRSASFALLPLVLLAGGYWYVTGGQKPANPPAASTPQAGVITVHPEEVKLTTELP